MNPVAPLGCLYLSIQIENVFIYGRGTENRTLINRLKAYYFAVKLYPRHLITLVTCHDRSPFKKLVPRTRIELVMTGYQPIVIPFNYPGKLNLFTARSVQATC